MLLLVPRDPLAPRRADEHFAPQAAAARELGVPVALVDHDGLTRDGGDADAAVLRNSTTSLEHPGAVAALGLPFGTVDLVRGADGVRRVVELGDGRVSDRPVSTPPAERVGAVPAGPAEMGS